MWVHWSFWVILKSSHRHHCKVYYHSVEPKDSLRHKAMPQYLHSVSAVLITVLCQINDISWFHSWCLWNLSNDLSAWQQVAGGCREAQNQTNQLHEASAEQGYSHNGPHKIKPLSAKANRGCRKGRQREQNVLASRCCKSPRLALAPQT